MSVNQDSQIYLEDIWDQEWTTDFNGTVPWLIFGFIRDYNDIYYMISVGNKQRSHQKEFNMYL